jgi:hypothetical protein
LPLPPLDGNGNVSDADDGKIGDEEVLRDSRTSKLAHDTEIAQLDVKGIWILN